MLTNLESKVRKGDYGGYGRNKFADASEFLNSHVRRLTVYLLD